MSINKQDRGRIESMSKAIFDKAESVIDDNIFIDEIAGLDAALEKAYQPYMRIDHTLNRKIVSFQANKSVPFYRWYK